MFQNIQRQTNDNYFGDVDTEPSWNNTGMF
jgi:hypothetical protein